MNKSPSLAYLGGSNLVLRNHRLSATLGSFSCASRFFFRAASCSSIQRRAASKESGKVCVGSMSQVDIYLCARSDVSSFRHWCLCQFQSQSGIFTRDPGIARHYDKLGRSLLIWTSHFEGICRYFDTSPIPSRHEHLQQHMFTPLTSRPSASPSLHRS